MKEKSKVFFTNNKIYILAFFIPFIMINVIFIFKGISPYGDNLLLFSDFFSQYGPMLDNFYNNAIYEGNLLYSFNYGLGQPIFKTFFNYLSSPFNLIIMLFGKEHFLESLSFLISLKASLSALTMAFFLSKKFKTKSLLIIPLSLCYAFCAYFQCYYFNIMWLDGMIFLPLIILGVENIINQKSAKLYVVSLFFMIWSNYYIAYMICLFTVVYFFFYLCYKTTLRKGYLKEDLKKFGKLILIFIGSSLLVGLLCSFFLIPYLFSLSKGESVIQHFAFIESSTYVFKVEPINFFTGHLAFSKANTLLFFGFTNPNITCGTLSCILVVLYFLNRNISLNNKMCYLSIISFLILAFLFAPIDHIFNAFHVPNDIPYRYSFIYSFVLIIMCAYSLFYLENLKKSVIVFVALFLEMTLFSLLFINVDNISDKGIIMNMIFIFIYFLLFVFLLMKKTQIKVIRIILSICIIIEFMFSLYINLNSKVDYNSYYNNSIADKDITSRNEVLNKKNINNSLIYDYYGTSSFSSVEYNSVAKLMLRLGLEGNGLNSYMYTDNTKLFNIMFNIGYLYDKDYTLKNKYFTELIYAVDNNIKNWKNISNPFELQNEFAKQAFNIEETLNKASELKKEVLYEDDEYIIQKIKFLANDNQLYFYTTTGVDFLIIDGVLYYYNSYYEKFENYDYMYYKDKRLYMNKYIINLKSNEIIMGYFKKNEDIQYDVYEENEEKLELISKNIESNKMIIEEFKEYEISGHINLDSGKTIYTSIPYDVGWNVYIDGKKVDTYKINDTLLGFDCEPGTHKITLRYKIPLLGISICISLITLLFMIVIRLFRKKQTN